MSVRTMNANRVWLFSILLGVAASGCAAIVGADGYEVGKGGGGSGGSGTSGGSSGAGGTGGSADGGKSDAATGGAGGATGGTGGATGGTGGATGGTGGGKGGTGGATGGTGGATGGTGGATGGTGGGPPPPPDGGGGTGGSMPPPTGLGETICNIGGSPCPSGQACQQTAFSPPGVCTQLCQTDATCGAGHQCVGLPDDPASFPFMCMKTCSATIACPTNFLCTTIMNGAVCLPTGWLDELGIGDDCIADEQCLSGTCRKPGGYCSKTCGPADALCAHSPSQFENRNGELNWCINSGGAQTCVPGCDVSGTCTFYPGTTCRTIMDIGGTMQRACVP
jgi:hypothetical protein